MAEVYGTCDERFEQVRQAFEANFDQGLDVGASAAVFLDGEPVVDLWGGHLDAEKTKPWQEDTIINVWSTTKTMTALCALMLADRGEIDFHAPVAKYWPEFAAAGKEGVEVRHLMSHTAGLSGWEEPIELTDLYDWEKVTSLLAAQEPWWEPGSASGYHAVTQGYLVGEVIRRVSGRSVGRFFAEEVAGPLGADFFIGTPPEADSRVAPVIAPTEMPTVADMEPGSIALRTFLNPVLDATASWTVPWRRAENPAAGPSRRSIRFSHAEARRGAFACCHPPDAKRSSRSSRTAPTSYSANQSGSGWASAFPGNLCRSVPTPVTGVVGEGRSS